MKYIPNIITSFRIVGTFILLFLAPLSPEFYILYTLCGISDVVDGTVARKCNLTSELGARLDSIADLMFYAVMLLKIMPILIEVLPTWVWCIIWTAVGIRVLSYVVAGIKYKRFASMHTYLNKATGAGVFTVPYVIKLPWAEFICGFIATVAGLASLEELLMHLTRKEYDDERKTILRI